MVIYNMGKIKDFFKKIKTFNMFDYFISRRIYNLTCEFDANNELIDYYKKVIEEAEDTIKDTMTMVNSYKDINITIHKKIADINKIK